MALGSSVAFCFDLGRRILSGKSRFWRHLSWSLNLRHIIFDVSCVRTSDSCQICVKINTCLHSERSVLISCEFSVFLEFEYQIILSKLAFSIASSSRFQKLSVKMKKSLTKREIVLGAGVSPVSPDFNKKCQNFVCSQLCFNSKTLNSKLKAMVSHVKKLYKKEGLYLRFE